MAAHWFSRAGGFRMLSGKCAVEEIDEPKGYAMTEAEIQDLVCVDSFGRASGEHCLLVDGECRFNVARVCSNRLSKLRTIKHCKVRPLAR